MLTLAATLIALLAQTQAPAPPADLAGRLSAPEFQARAAAVGTLEAAAARDPAVLDSEAIQVALTTLLEAENAAIKENFEHARATRESRRTEAHSEYYSQVLGLADRVRRLLPAVDESVRPRLLRALVRGSYNSDSPFARGLAQEGERLVASILELAGSPNEPKKWNALGLITYVFRYRDASSLAAPLSASSERDLRAAARKALRDPSLVVRRHAVEAVVAAKDTDAIPVLRELARADPDVDRGQFRHSVRSLANDALMKLFQQPR